MAYILLCSFDLSKYSKPKIRPLMEITAEKDRSQRTVNLEAIIEAQKNGHLAFAKEQYQKLIEAGCREAIIYSNMASIYSQEDDNETALELLKEAIRIDPEYLDAYLKMGCALEILAPDHPEQIMACYLKVLELDRNNLPALNLSAQFMKKQGLAEQSLEYYKRIAALQPQDASIQYNLGVVSMLAGQLDESANAYKKVLRIDKNLGGALGKFWFTRMKMCDWSDYHREFPGLKKRIHRILDEDQPADIVNTISPFALLGLFDDPAIHLKASKRFCEMLCKNMATAFKPQHSMQRKNDQQIKVAFLSADFHDHATTYLMAELFELMDEGLFEIHAISYGKEKADSRMKMRIASACHNFHDVRTRSDQEIADLISELEINIAVDLKGYTQNCRPAILAGRPAPIQINYLGYPGSMGAGFIDYIIADPYVIPEQEQCHYSEKIVYLPGCYQVNDRKRKVHPDTPSREECGLPANAFVYCCFNQSYKITPEIFTLWMSLLKETDNSVLWLIDDNPWATKNLKKEAKKRGVDPKRLVFAEKLPIERHLARIRNADLFLDTYPCNAHTTASDALWVGVPLITMRGRSFAARVAGSLLCAAGLDELITNDEEAYRSLALELAHNKDKHRQLKDRLKTNRDSCSLFDSETYTKNLQRGFMHMLDLHDSGSDPETFYVSDLEDKEIARTDSTTPTSPEAGSLVINIVIIRPEGYIHSDAFQEIAETLSYSFNELGFITNIAENTFIEDGINIILGAHLLQENDMTLIPSSSILYNFEQITETSDWMTPALFNLFNAFTVWDYSQKNLKALKEKGIKSQLQHVPVGYCPALTRIPKPEIQDIDVLFYGSLNERRKKILDALKEAGLNVETLFGVYGRARDEYIARSKVIINIHYYDSNIFEQVRIAYLLANKKAVVCENSEESDLDDSLKEAVAMVPYDQLVTKCCELVRSDEQRNRLEEKGFDYISSRNAVEYLNTALTALGEESKTIIDDLDLAVPRILNIGSGKDFREDCLNIDLSEKSHPDVIADLSDVHLIGKTVHSKRFGDITFAENQFDEIIANDVLEHIPDLVTAMTNCLDLLKVGGQFKINVPYDLSYGAWQDPTHVRAFNERSWLYYTDWYWYLGWQKARFDLTTMNFVLSPVGTKMQQEGKSSDQILTQPRAVDSMSIILTKRLLTPEEKAIGQQRMAGV